MNELKKHIWHIILWEFTNNKNAIETANNNFSCLWSRCQSFVSMIRQRYLKKIVGMQSAHNYSKINTWLQHNPIHTLYRHLKKIGKLLHTLSEKNKKVFNPKYSTRPCCLVQVISLHPCPDPDLGPWNCLAHQTQIALRESMTSRVRVSARSRPDHPLDPHLIRPSCHWPCVKPCLVGGRDKCNRISIATSLLSRQRNNPFLKSIIQKWRKMSLLWQCSTQKAVEWQVGVSWKKSYAE